MNSQEIPNKFHVWLLATRPRTLPAAIAPVLTGTALAYKAKHFDLYAALICLGFAILIQIGTNFANDYFDFIKGTDDEKRVGPKRAVASGWISPTSMRSAMALVFGCAFVLGLGLVSRGGPWMIGIGLASIACGIAYTAGPYALAYLGLGDIFVFIFFGLVAVDCTYYVQTRSLTWDALLAAIPLGLLASNILVVNNYRDMETDAVSGKRTLVVRFGRTFSQVQFALSLLISFIIPLVLLKRGYPIAVLLPLVLIPLASSHFRRLVLNKKPQEQILLLGDTGKLLAMYAIAFSLGIIL
jgi:1,4-dihydroxy-2-naphthoate octaprenyltransferase